MNDLALVESKSLREEKINDVEVLDKVKTIKYMTDSMIVSVDQAAEYYEVGKKAVTSIIQRHDEELKFDGLKVLKGDELKKFKTKLQDEVTLKHASHFRIIPRRALLRIGMLLRDSEIAKEVRNYLLNTEERSSQFTPNNAIAAYKEVKESLNEAAASATTKFRTLKSLYSQAGIELPISEEEFEVISDEAPQSNQQGLNNQIPDSQVQNPYVNTKLLRKIINENNWTIKETAKYVGLSRKHFSQLINRHSRAGRKSQHKLISTFPNYKEQLFIRM